MLQAWVDAVMGGILLTLQGKEEGVGACLTCIQGGGCHLIVRRSTERREGSCVAMEGSRGEVGMRGRVTAQASGEVRSRIQVYRVEVCDRAAHGVSVFP